VAKSAGSGAGFNKKGWIRIQQNVWIRKAGTGFSKCLDPEGWIRIQQNVWIRQAGSGFSKCLDPDSSKCLDPDLAKVWIRIQ
jgi:hypothetical protein